MASDSAGAATFSPKVLEAESLLFSGEEEHAALVSPSPKSHAASTMAPVERSSNVTSRGVSPCTGVARNAARAQAGPVGRRLALRPRHTLAMPQGRGRMRTEGRAKRGLGGWRSSSALASAGRRHPTLSRGCVSAVYHGRPRNLRGRRSTRRDHDLTVGWPVMGGLGWVAGLRARTCGTVSYVALQNVCPQALQELSHSCVATLTATATGPSIASHRRVWPVR